MNETEGEGAVVPASEYMEGDVPGSNQNNEQQGGDAIKATWLEEDDAQASTSSSDQSSKEPGGGGGGAGAPEPERYWDEATDQAMAGSNQVTRPLHGGEPQTKPVPKEQRVASPAQSDFKSQGGRRPRDPNTLDNVKKDTSHWGRDASTAGGYPRSGGRRDN